MMLVPECDRTMDALRPGTTVNDEPLGEGMPLGFGCGIIDAPDGEAPDIGERVSVLEGDSGSTVELPRRMRCSCALLPQSGTMPSKTTRTTLAGLYGRSVRELSTLSAQTWK